PEAIGLLGLALPAEVLDGADVVRPHALDAQAGALAGELLEHGHLVDRLAVRVLKGFIAVKRSDKFARAVAHGEDRHGRGERHPRGRQNRRAERDESAISSRHPSTYRSRSRPGDSRWVTPPRQTPGS